MPSWPSHRSLQSAQLQGWVCCSQCSQVCPIPFVHNGPWFLGKLCKKHLSQLPEPYTTVQPVILPKKEPPVTILQGPFILSSCLQMPSAFVTEYKWLDNVRDCLNQEITNDILNLSWAAYHASQVSVDHPRQLDLTSLMPLFQESAHSAATIRHAMEVVRQAVRFLNPGQVPVLACDEPLLQLLRRSSGTGQQCMVNKSL